jgi:hypothetical protein
MLTLFTSPKPFTDPHISVIQRNALTSWTLLRPRPEIILFGDEAGTAQVSRELGLRHIPDVPCNEFGTPLLNGLIKEAEHRAGYDVLCYVNADIILRSDFLNAVRRVLACKQRFLVTGCRWDVDITDSLDFQAQDWEQKLGRLVAATGRLHRGGADYFIFPRGLFRDLPPLALGRGYWDNWLLWKALHEGTAVVDATFAITAIHQRHCSPAQWQVLMSSAEVVRNLEQASFWARSFTPADASHRLVNGTIRKNSWKPYRHRLWVATYPLRYRLARMGFGKSNWYGLRHLARSKAKSL